LWFKFNQMEIAELNMAAAIALHRSVTLTLSLDLFRRLPVKKIVLALAVAVATAAAANAQTAAKPAPAAKTSASKAGDQTKSTAKHEAHAKAESVKGEVVSTDATAKTITVKDASGSNVTLTATGSAVAELAKLKPGDMVMVTKSASNATKITKAKTTETKPKK
jgi:glucose/arabinose dehydrogenase